MRAIELIIILVQLLACGAEYGNEASVKFITSAGLGKPLGNYYLIQEVHKPAWLIRYGFSDNDLCRSSSDSDEFNAEKFEQQIKASIVKAIRLWLQPLREMDSEIIDEFNLVLVDTKTKDDTQQSDRRTHTLVRSDDSQNKEQLGIVFHCAEKDRDTKYPNSFIAIGSNKLREVHLYHYHNQRKHFPRDRITDVHMFMMTAIIHELGHAFGLADTYISSKSSSNTSNGTINHSTGGSTKTVGKQPMAMMGFASLVGVSSEGEPFITVDDIEGIRWLYRLAYDKASVNTCPEDYVAESDTLGCAPRYPLIFAVKKGDLATVVYILRDDSTTINICDQQGNTALFYAKQHHDRHGSNLDKFLLKQGADPSTACAEENKQVDNNQAASIADVQSNDAEADPYSYRKGANTACGTLRHASSPEHTLLLLLIVLGIPLLVARARGAKLY